MNKLDEADVLCPYCGESISVLIDCSVDSQRYIEDCQVCCRPINFDVQMNDEDTPIVRVSNENE